MISIQKGISVIICTYNGAQRLPEVLKYIQSQRVDKSVNWELIIVDNNSSDNTRDTINACWSSVPQPACPLRVLHEKRAGVTFARNKAIEEATYEYLVFCDDDNLLFPDFVQRAYVDMESDPMIGAIGSYGRPLVNGEIPSWFTEYEDYFAVGPQGISTGDITKTKSFVYGAGSVFRRSALLYLKENGFVNRLNSKTGKSLVTGEDNEFCYALIMAGFRIWYDAELHFYHQIPPGRLKFSYFSRLIKAYSYSSFLLAPYVEIIKGIKRKPYKYSTAWNILVVMVLIIRFDLFSFPKYILSSEIYRLKIAWMVRMGGLQAILRHPGYQFKLRNELEVAKYNHLNG